MAVGECVYEISLAQTPWFLVLENGAKCTDLTLLTSTTIPTLTYVPKMLPESAPHITPACYSSLHKN